MKCKLSVLIVKGKYICNWDFLICNRIFFKMMANMVAVASV